MKYTENEKMLIAEKVVNHKLLYKEAAATYKVSIPSIAQWVKKYKTNNNISTDGRKTPSNFSFADNNHQDLNSMSKQQLIDEVIKARIGEERAKKGYTVKGGGQKKEYVILSNRSTE